MSDNNASRMSSDLNAAFAALSVGQGAHCAYTRVSIHPGSVNGVPPPPPPAENLESSANNAVNANNNNNNLDNISEEGANDANQLTKQDLYEAVQRIEDSFSNKVDECSKNCRTIIRGALQAALTATREKRPRQPRAKAKQAAAAQSPAPSAAPSVEQPAQHMQMMSPLGSESFGGLDINLCNNGTPRPRPLVSILQQRQQQAQLMGPHTPIVEKDKENDAEVVSTLVSASDKNCVASSSSSSSSSSSKDSSKRNQQPAEGVVKEEQLGTLLSTQVKEEPSDHSDDESIWSNSASDPARSE
ncbi:unnamed protein product [Amoebophrya sp. A25]|nr:unnamed protein product [Amoebophrya sp. A25]|eukprot:GSA25T00013002001.1